MAPSKKTKAKPGPPPEILGPALLLPPGYVPPKGPVSKAAPQDIENVLGAAYHGNFEGTKQWLLQHQDKKLIDCRSYTKKFTLLQATIGGGSLPLLDFLLKADAKVALADKRGCTALMTAAVQEDTAMLARILASPSGKAAIDAVDNDGSTALHHAAYCGKVHATKALMAAGAQTDLADKQGRTAAEDAEESGHASVAKLLVDGLPDPNATEPSLMSGDAGSIATSRRSGAASAVSSIKRQLTRKLTAKFVSEPEPEE